MKKLILLSLLISLISGTFVLSAKAVAVSEPSVDADLTTLFSGDQEFTVGEESTLSDGNNTQLVRYGLDYESDLSGVPSVHCLDASDWFDLKLIKMFRYTNLEFNELQEFYFILMKIKIKILKAIEACGNTDELISNLKLVNNLLDMVKYKKAEKKKEYEQIRKGDRDE